MKTVTISSLGSLKECLGQFPGNPLFRGQPRHWEKDGLPSRRASGGSGRRANRCVIISVGPLGRARRSCGAVIASSCGRPYREASFGRRCLWREDY